MDDVTRALERATEKYAKVECSGKCMQHHRYDSVPLCEPGQCFNATRAAVLAFLKEMPNWRNEVSEIPWTPLSLAAAIEKERANDR